MTHVNSFQKIDMSMSGKARLHICMERMHMGSSLIPINPEHPTLILSTLDSQKIELREYTRPISRYLYMPHMSNPTSTAQNIPNQAVPSTSTFSVSCLGALAGGWRVLRHHYRYGYSQPNHTCIKDFPSVRNYPYLSKPTSNDYSTWRKWMYSVNTERIVWDIHRW